MGHSSKKSSSLPLPTSLHASFAGFVLLRQLTRRKKTKIPTFLQLFCDCGLFSIRLKGKRAVAQPITCDFAMQSAVRGS